jgi:ABC-type uncharacterized transport system permease subunit
MKKKYQTRFFGALILTTFLVGSSALAEETIPTVIGTIDINTFVARIINYVLSMVGSIALILFIYGGLLWMTAGGSAAKVDKGKKVIVWSVIGMGIVFFSYMIVRFTMQQVVGNGG